MKLIIVVCVLSVFTIGSCGAYHNGQADKNSNRTCYMVKQTGSSILKRKCVKTTTRRAKKPNPDKDPQSQKERKQP